jgi:hypothetical protein
MNNSLKSDINLNNARKLYNFTVDSAQLRCKGSQTLLRINVFEPFEGDFIKNPTNPMVTFEPYEYFQLLESDHPLTIKGKCWIGKEGTEERFQFCFIYTHEDESNPQPLNILQIFRNYHKL